MKLQRVNIKQAELLKEKEFDWECTYYYRKWYNEIQLREDHSSNFNSWIKTVEPFEDLCSAPSIQFALKWFRDVKGIPNGIYPLTNACSYIYRFWEYNGSLQTSFTYNSHEEAESALLDELLKLEI